MKIRASHLRDGALVSTLLLAAAFVGLRPIEKARADQRIDLPAFVQPSFGAWRSQTYDTAGYKDRWQSINELLVRLYYRENPFSLRSRPAQVHLVLEYSSDLRQNFSFHFPENCHRSGGNAIENLEPLTVDLGDGRTIVAKRIYIHGQRGSIEETDKLVTYWIVIGGKAYHKMFFIKLDQMLAGLLTRAAEGFLVRVDSSEGIEFTPETMESASRVTASFIRNLYESLDERQKSALFGSRK
jgi:EpsI family protein